MRYLNIYILLLIILSSCHQRQLFQEVVKDQKDWSSEKLSKHIIDVDDKITISIWNHDELSIGNLYNIHNVNEEYGKWLLVEQDGSIELPKVGKFHIKGLTMAQTEDSLKVIYGKFIVNPLITIKVINREVTVLGEVRTPGVFVLDKETTTLMEMIGRSQGFIQHSDLSKVTLIRDNKKYEFNLIDANNLYLNAINMKSGDVIFVPALKGKMIDQNAPRIIPFASVTTAIAILLTLFLK